MIVGIHSPWPAQESVVCCSPFINIMTDGPNDRYDCVCDVWLVTGRCWWYSMAVCSFRRGITDYLCNTKINVSKRSSHPLSNLSVIWQHIIYLDSCYFTKASDVTLWTFLTRAVFSICLYSPVAFQHSGIIDKLLSWNLYFVSHCICTTVLCTATVVLMILCSGTCIAAQLLTV